MRNFKKSVLSVGSFLMLVGVHSVFAQSTGSIGGNSPVVDKIFPYYTLECSVTQLQPIDGKPGGTGGHALMYLKGACRDTSVNYPKVKMCDPGADYTDPATGVAVSIDKILENTTFIATDGKDFMFDGALESGEAVGPEALERTEKAVVASGALNGVKIHDTVLAGKPAGMSDEDFIAKTGADTDYAILFARTASCVLIPMDRQQIEAEVEYINSSNEPYVSGEKSYAWNGLADNCTNFTHDVLAAAGIRKAVPRSNSLGRKVLNLLTLHMQVPKNETLATEQFVNDISKIDSAEVVFADTISRGQFEAFATLPQTGGIWHTYEMDTTNNTLYKPAKGALFLDVPFFKPRTKALNKIMADPLYNDVAQNLKSVLDRMTEVQSQRKAVDASDQSDEAVFARKYNAWIDQSIQDISQKLQTLSANAQ